MKKSLLLLLPLVLSTVTLAACGGNNGGSKKTTITLWSITGKNNQGQLENYIKAFEDKYPEYKVNNVIQTGMGYNELKDAVVKGFSGNNYPDIVQCYPDHVADYLDYGKAVNLDDYINDPEIGLTEKDKNDYIASFMDEGKGYAFEGTYSLPYCKSTELMFYNEDVLLSLDLSKYDATINGGKALDAAYFDNLTWEELFNKLCPALIKYNDSLPEGKKILLSDQKYHAVFAYDSDDNLFITLAEQYGYKYTSVDTSTGKGSIDFDNAEMKNLMKTFRTAADKGYIISKGSAGNTYTNEYFTANNTLFSVGSSGGVKYQFSDSNPMNVGVARIPHAEGRDPKVILQGPSLTVLDHNDEARIRGSWLLWKTMTDAENSLDWAINSGYMGIRSSNYENEDYKAASDVKNTEEKTLARLMAKASTYVSNIINETYTSPAFKGSSAARSAVGGLMTKVLTPTEGIENIDTWFSDAVNQTRLQM